MPPGFNAPSSLTGLVKATVSVSGSSSVILPMMYLVSPMPKLGALVISSAKYSMGSMSSSSRMVTPTSAVLSPCAKATTPLSSREKSAPSVARGRLARLVVVPSPLSTLSLLSAVLSESETAETVTLLSATATFVRLSVKAVFVSSGSSVTVMALASSPLSLGGSWKLMTLSSSAMVTVTLFCGGLA